MLLIVKEIGELLRTHKLTLGAVESATGGLISHLITDVPGKWPKEGEKHLAPISVLQIPESPDLPELRPGNQSGCFIYVYLTAIAPSFADMFSTEIENEIKNRLPSRLFLGSKNT